MKITGHKKLIRQLDDLPGTARAHIKKAIKMNAEEGARVARTLAPVQSGKAKAQITTTYSSDGMRGTVVVIENDAPQADKDATYSIEHGRKDGNRGTTEGAHYVWTTRQYLEKKFKGRITRAVNKAVKEVSNRG